MRRFLFLILFIALGGGGASAGDFNTQTMSWGQHKKIETALYLPRGAGPFPMMLVLHTSGGISEYDRGYCANLAREGYICAAPAFLRAYGDIGELRRLSFTRDAHSIYDDFVEMIREMNALPQAKHGTVGAVGFSNGGFFTAALASTRRIKAGVSYYGAFDGARTHPDLDIFRKWWTKESAPFLILAGTNDTTIGKETPAMLERIIKGAGAPYEMKWYPDAGHDFDRAGDTGAGNRAAAADAWQRTLAFLRANGV